MLSNDTARDGKHAKVNGGTKNYGISRFNDLLLVLLNLWDKKMFFF